MAIAPTLPTYNFTGIFHPTNPSWAEVQFSTGYFAWLDVHSGVFYQLNGQPMGAPPPAPTPPAPPPTPVYGHNGRMVSRIRSPDGTWTELEDFEDPAPACECGAFKTFKAKKGDPAHSSWCPWAKK